ncbi:hypothetical protein SCA6_010793 [Theobroma cacao]
MVVFFGTNRKSHCQISVSHFLEPDLFSLYGSLHNSQSSLRENDAQCIFGMLIYCLDRLYSAVRGQAKTTGEWQCLKQDIIDLGKPGLQTAYKLIVTARMERVYDCLLPSLKRQ